MSERFPGLNDKEVTTVLKAHGFAAASQKGSHQKWRHTDDRQVIVPFLGSKLIPIGTLKSIVKGSGLDEEHFR